MAILVDGAHWPAHDRHWCHLVSSESLDELHGFAAALGVPERAFDRDHYDIHEELRAAAIDRGALPVSARELVEALHRSGLRRQPGLS
ncbi:MAG: DUF4031 domain-containing protein [Candidatus Nanopelagicales bacterium]|nr:DUF4031 domain-containing protein [Candidatus Nanopelagicales bacterium]